MKTEIKGSDPVIQHCKGTNPLLTVLLFGGIVAAVIATGSHFSERHGSERDLDVAATSASAMTLAH